MANSDKNILIVPNTNQSGLPNIQFVGSSSAPISLSVLDDNTLSFSGSQGQLFSINNNLTSGTIFSVNDVSGIPSIEVDASGTITLGEFGGNVGIGTGTPTHKLTVVGAISASSYIGAASTPPGGTNQTVQFNSGSTFSGSSNLVWDYTNNILKVNGQFTSVGSGNSLQFWKDSTPTKAINLGMSVPGGGPLTNDVIFSAYDGTTWSERLRITNDGNVGIGTSSPNYLFEVRRDQNSSNYLGVTNTINGTSAIAGIYVNNGAKGFSISYRPAAYTDDSVFADSAVLRTDSTITGSLSFESINAPIRFYHGSIRSLCLEITSSETVINQDGRTMNFRVESDNNQNMFLVDSSLDRISINKASPNATLDVNGNTIISGNLTVTGSITELSTRRIKTNIQTINNELNNLYKLNPVSYVRLDDGRKEYGFISEEVKEVYPEFVVGEGINYPKMVSVLVSAVKELTQKVQQQQTEIELIKSRGNI